MSWTSNEKWYDRNYPYVILHWFKCIAMIFGKVQVFQVARLPETRYSMTKLPEHSATVWSMIGC
jgi:hypothetical protein